MIGRRTPAARGLHFTGGTRGEDRLDVRRAGAFADRLPATSRDMELVGKLPLKTPDEFKFNCRRGFVAAGPRPGADRRRRGVQELRLPGFVE